MNLLRTEQLCSVMMWWLSDMMSKVIPGFILLFRNKKSVGMLFRHAVNKATLAAADFEAKSTPFCKVAPPSEISLRLSNIDACARLDSFLGVLFLSHSHCKIPDLIGRLSYILRIFCRIYNIFIPLISLFFGIIRRHPEKTISAAKRFLRVMKFYTKRLTE